MANGLPPNRPVIVTASELPSDGLIPTSARGSRARPGSRLASRPPAWVGVGRVASGLVSMRPTDDGRTGPRAIAWRLHDLARTAGYRPVEVPALALEAAKWRSARDSIELPVELQGFNLWEFSRATALAEGVLDLQREWLETARPEELQTYIPTLARYATGHPEHAGNVSSEPISDLVVAALTGALKSTTTDQSVVLYDPVCGSAGMLAAAAQSLEVLGFRPSLFGRDLDQVSAYLASCAIFLGSWDGLAVTGNSLATDDKISDLRYDYAVAEPPFGMSWQSVSDDVRAEAEAGQYPGGLPALSDSTLLFVQHLVSRMRPPDEGGGRAVILTNSSSLRSGGGDSIRRWLLEQNLLEAIIGLPEGIAAATSIRLNALILTNRRSNRQEGRVQLVDLRGTYEDLPRTSLSRRRLRPDALDSLKKALSSSKPGPISRTVPRDRFVYRTAIVSTAISGHSGDARSWRLRVSADDDSDQYLGYHVQSPSSEIIGFEEGEACQIDLDEIMNRDAGHAAAWIRERKWARSRLAAVADNPTYVRSASADDRYEILAALETEPVVMLPVEANRQTVFGNPMEVAPDGRFFAFTVDDALSPEFLVDYLNSRVGTSTRRAALEMLGGGSSPRTVSRGFANQMFAAIEIPIPDPATQQRMVDADIELHAAATLATRTAEELWRTPERRVELVRRVGRLAESQSLGDWAQELPYPLATALWACEAQKANAYAAHDQLFLFWEATAAFVGTVLLSALDQDESLRAAEMQAIRRAMAGQHLSMQRATLGVWQILTQRLGRKFRSMLDSEDPDERARVDALFAGAPEDLIRAMCSTEFAQILALVIQRRNEWKGHGGATTDLVLREQNSWLRNQVEALHPLFGDLWREAPLVRAGQSSFQDGLFTYAVELVMGLNTPFLTQSVTVGTPMNTGQLYLVTDGAQRALQIEPLVQLRSSPDSAKFAAYFYNRLEGHEARLVSYHLGSDGDVHEESQSISNLVADFEVPQENNQIPTL
jgi:hypothetical protein